MHESPLHKCPGGQKTYNLELISQKYIYYEQKLYDCGNNYRKIFKTVNSILGSNINQKPNALANYLMCTSYLKCLSSKLSSISDCIKSNLALSPIVLTINRISQPLSSKLTICSSPTIIEIHNLIVSANSIYPIDPHTLIVFIKYGSYTQILNIKFDL